MFVVPYALNVIGLTAAAYGVADAATFTFDAEGEGVGRPAPSRSG